MELAYSSDEQAFRDEVREFLASELPRDIAHKTLEGLNLERDDYVRWHKALYRRGWAGVSWPKSFGGTGWTVVQQHIFEEECAAAGAPRIIPFGVTMVAPVLMAFGSKEQQQRFLPRILAFDDWWCQGYSEPGSGSDLASLKTRAERKGDKYVVNGQKTWTTLAQYADWIFCLVRTDLTAKPQMGISFLLIDMKTPGVTVRPIITMDGGHEVNDVFFDNVEVPVENLVGEENKGWTYAKYLLAHERTGIANVGVSKRELARLKRIAAQEMKGGRPLIEDPTFAAKVANVEMELMALEITVLRVIAAARAAKQAGPEAAMVKIRGSELSQALTELMVEAVGSYALPYNRDWFAFGSNAAPVGPVYAAPLGPAYANMRKTTIYGGSNEIQKNIIAQVVLGA